jgi:hypothetical protein
MTIEFMIQTINLILQKFGISIKKKLNNKYGGERISVKNSTAYARVNDKAEYVTCY